MARSLKRPWREVVYIEYRDTRGGGRAWFLTLECGHHISRSIPAFTASMWYKNPPLAPKKVRCLVCKELEA